VLFMREAYGHPDRWAWTGFAPSATGKKTLWDWLQLLGVVATPVVVAVGGFLFTQQQQQQADRSSAAQQASDAAIALDQARETLLNTYIDRMSDLLMPTDPFQTSLINSGSGDEARVAARIRALDVLGRLDGARKRQVLQFLYEANLIGGVVNTKRIVNLQGADLSEAALHVANLHIADLSGVILSGADLSSAQLRGINLSDANLSRANLRAANLYCDEPSHGSPTCANLGGATLRGADLSGANLSGANLSRANLSCARPTKGIPACTNLSGANLSWANLSGANLSGANLSGANLSGAKGITDAQVEQATTLLSGTILPSGKRHQ
jgi:uncharacterized protein YjbI with pentapeptide repeats